MKFEPARASQIFEALGQPAFAESEGERRAADFVSVEFERIGLTVDRREVQGSRFPQQYSAWIGWLGAGLFPALGCVFLLSGHPLGLLVFVVWLFPSLAWVNALLSNRLRFGTRIGKQEAAPLVRGFAGRDESAPVRIVFQSVLGGLKTDYFQQFRFSRFFVVSIFNLVSVIAMVLAPLIAIKLGSSWLFARAVSTACVALVWIGILQVLHWEYVQSRLPQDRRAIDRRGIAVLLELARSWSRARSRQIETVFIAAGGQSLNYAGSREVLRMIESEWPRKPTLLILFFAPGAGDAVRVAPVWRELEALANQSAESLWVPVWGTDPFTILQFWPFEFHRASQAIALIGSDPAAFFDSAVSPESLQRTALLAMEIALRWAKKKSGESPSPLSLAEKASSSHSPLHSTQ